MADINLSPDALSDLRQTKIYIAEELGSEQAAVNTLEKITKRIRILADYPETVTPLSSIVDFDTDFRYLVCGNYTAFYRYENNSVHILQVLYNRRDFMRILFDIESEEK